MTIKGSIDGFLDDEELKSQQTKDWRKLKVIALRINRSRGEQRKQLCDDLYNGVKDYFYKYKIKFDYSRKPE